MLKKEKSKAKENKFDGTYKSISMMKKKTHCLGYNGYCIVYNCRKNAAEVKFKNSLKNNEAFMSLLLDDTEFIKLVNETKNTNKSDRNVLLNNYVDEKAETFLESLTTNKSWITFNKDILYKDNYVYGLSIDSDTKLSIPRKFSVKHTINSMFNLKDNHNIKTQVMSTFINRIDRWIELSNSENTQQELSNEENEQLEFYFEDNKENTSQLNHYEDKIDLDRASESMQYLVEHNTFKEILWIMRNLSYEQVSYWDDEHKGIIYQDDSYSHLNREQACRIQRMLSTACDLFGQSVINKREFDEGYLVKWLEGGALELQVASLQSRIKDLEAIIKEGNY